MRIQHHVEIAAPPARVWEVTVDVESLPELTTTMTEVARLEQAPLGVGSTVRVKQPAQRPKIWTVTVFDLDRRFRWTTRSRGSVMTASHDLTETPLGMRNTLTLDMRGLVGTVIGVIARRQLRKALATENEGLKLAAEARQKAS